MSSKDLFKTTSTGIRVTDVKSSFATNIVTVSVPKTHVVESFSPSTMKDHKGMKYEDIMRNNTVSNDRRNQRFRMSDHLRSMMSVSAEEEQKIEQEVSQRVNAQVQAIQERVTKEAYQAGLALGKEAAHLEVLRDSRPVVEKFHKILSSFEGMKEDVFKANEDLLIKMVYRLAKMVILKEVKEDTAYTKRLIVGLLERLGTRDNIKIFLSPEAFSISSALKATLAETLGLMKNISLEPDSEIKDTGCRIETDFADVDATIQTQLENIASTLDIAQA